jgi:hypothetical protein
VKAELKLHPVTSLAELMDYAQRIDEKNVLLNQGTAHTQKSTNFNKSYPSNRTVTVDTTNKGNHTKPATNTTAGDTSGTKNSGSFRNRPFKRLTDEELQDKFTKGLCFRCDERFSPGHICPNKQFKVLIMEEEDDNIETPQQTSESDSALNNLQLSMYSIFGFTSKRTLKLWGDLDDHKVLVLVDCGASHNFISSRLVKDMGLALQATTSFTVEVGDGRKIPCEGVCQQLVLNIQGLYIQQDFYIFELGNVDIVLGMEWLAQLGEIRANFGDLILKVPTQTGVHVLKGDPTLSRAVVSLKSMYKALQAAGEAYLLIIQANSAAATQQFVVP